MLTSKFIWVFLFTGHKWYFCYVASMGSPANITTDLHSVGVISNMNVRIIWAFSNIREIIYKGTEYIIQTSL